MNNQFVKEFIRLNLVLNNYFLLNDITEIRYIKGYNRKKTDYLINRTPWRLLFMDNDWIGFDPKGVIGDFSMIYFFRLKNGNIYIIGMFYEYSDNNVRSEKLIYNKKVSLLLYKLLISKYNKIWKP